MENSQFGLTLNNLVGYELQIFTNDGKTIKGVLSGIQNDYLVMESQDNKLIYHSLQNIKGVSKNTKGLKKKTQEINNNDATLKSSAEEVSLSDVLKSHQHKWITINGDNDDEFSGILSKIEDDHVVLIGKDEQLFLNTAHIKNVLRQDQQTSANTEGTAEMNSASNSQNSNSTSNSNTQNSTTNSNTENSSSNSNNSSTRNNRSNNYQGFGREKNDVIHYSVFGSEERNMQLNSLSKNKKK